MISIPSFERRPGRALLRLALAAGALVAARLGAVPAFPGAEGFGANASGGRGGAVYHVTNLNDSGTGSFRDAVSVAGRTVVFDVGGIVTITSPVVVKANITIAGQTAPGEGITIYGDRLSYSDANNTITRYIRYREGIGGDSGTDAVGAASGDGMIFDHVSASWGRDETFSLSGTPSHITLQDCIIGQGLLIHSAGSLMQTSGGVSIFRTLYTDNHMRNPKIKGVNDYENNVVYNWGTGGGINPAGDSAGLSYVNIVGCYFIAGPTTPTGMSPFLTGNQNFNLYHADNFHDANVNGVLDGVPVTDAYFPTLHLVSTPFDYPKPATVLSAEQAFGYVMANAGASLHRDHADQYMIAELASLGTSGAQIYDESAIGGVGTVAGGITPKDTDGDGMPDWWEQAAGTNPTVADNNVLNADGYTNLEHYLNALAPGGVQAATIDGLSSDTGSSASDGVTANNRLVLHGTASAGAVVTLSRVDLGTLGTVTAGGDGKWTFDYSANALADRFYGFQATVDLGNGQVSPPTRVFVVQVDTTAAAAPVITSIVASPAIVLNGTSEPGSTVTITVAGTGDVGTGVADGYGNWSVAYTGPALTPGAYSFTARAVDQAGNVGPAAPAYAVDTSLAAPVITGIVNDTGASASDRITNDTSLIFNGTSFANAKVTLTRVGVGVIGSATATSGGTWSFDFTGTALPAGTHTFFATASNGGAASPASAPFAVTIDTTKPAISSIRRVSPSTSATTASTLVYRASFTEPVTGVDLADFTLTKGSGVAGTLASITTVAANVYDVTVTGAAGDGTIRLDLKSSGTGIADIAGNAISGGYTAGQSFTIRLPGSGVWGSSENGDAWSDTANWQDGIVASGNGATADFGQQNVDGDLAVTLDAPRTVGRIVFGDTDWTTPAQWRLTDNGVVGNTLTLAGPTPTLQVDAATSPSGDTVDVPAANDTPSKLDVVLAGTDGFTKTGVGTLQIVKPATITGPLTIAKGIVQVGPGGSLAPSAVTIATSQQLRVAGGAFSTTGDVTWKSGTGTGIVVSDGTASFQRILPSNARNSFVRVTGGIMTATEINFPRSGDSESQALGVGVQVSGGDLTVGTVGLGTADSWGAMTVSGGHVAVTGALNVGWQKTSGRGGDVVVTSGQLDVTDPATGLILARNPGTNANNVAKLTIKGGVVNAARVALGYDATVSGGSATVTVTGGELNLGTAGIVKNGTSGLASKVSLTGGTLGAAAAWSTTEPISVDGASTDVALRAGDQNGNAFDVVLAGGVVGTGGFTKTGGGTLTVDGASTYPGETDVNAGALRVVGTLAAATAPVVINAGGQLGGNGQLNRDLILNAGGTVAPEAGSGLGTLSAASLTWNAGGTLAVRLGANGQSDQLAVAGAFAKSGAGSFVVAFTPGVGFAAANTYTLATFATTNFDAGDFVASGLPAGTVAAFAVVGTTLQVHIKAVVPVTIGTAGNGTMQRAYDGTPQPATITTSPAALNANFTYNGSTVVPTLPGTYEVVATLDEPDYVGTGRGTLVITITALVRHAPTIAGELDGSFQMLSGENAALSGTALVSGDLLVPGTPTVTTNGGATLAGTHSANGSVSPADYTVTLNGRAMARYLVNHVDAIALPVLTAPQTPAGNRDVTLNRASDGLGNAATVRNVTISGTAGRVALPPGAYGTVTVSGANALVLGNAGSAAPVIYDLQRLTLNGSAVVQVVGPVVLRVANDVAFSGAVGSADNLLTIELYRSGTTLGGAANVHAVIVAPNGAVKLGGSAVLNGRVTADQLQIDGGAVLEEGGAGNP